MISIEELSVEERNRFNAIMSNVNEDMKNVQKDSNRMAFEAHISASNAIMNC